MATISTLRHMPLPAIGQRLLVALEHAGKKAYWVDQQSPWAVGYTSKIARGDQASMPVDRCEQIAKVLGVSPCWLAFGIGDMVAGGEGDVSPLDAAVAWFEGRISDAAEAMVRDWARRNPRPNWKPVAWGQVLKRAQVAILDGEDVEITDEWARAG